MLSNKCYLYCIITETKCARHTERNVHILHKTKRVSSFSLAKIMRSNTFQMVDERIPFSIDPVRAK